jgi:hypothetical protein
MKVRLFDLAVGTAPWISDGRWLPDLAMVIEIYHR